GGGFGKLDVAAYPFIHDHDAQITHAGAAVADDLALNTIRFNVSARDDQVHDLQRLRPPNNVGIAQRFAIGIEGRDAQVDAIHSRRRFVADSVAAFLIGRILTKPRTNASRDLVHGAHPHAL